MQTRLIVALFAGMVFLHGACSPSIPLETEAPTEISYSDELQTALDELKLEGYETLGVSAAVLVPEHRIWAGASGASTQGEPMKTDMLFDAGSILKVMEAVLALQLVEQGALDLNAPISDWLPPLNNVDDRITVHQLLNHTSGLYNVFEHPEFPWVGGEVDYAYEWQLEEVFNNFVLEPHGSPGETQHYASTNYLLLSEILSQEVDMEIAEAIEGSSLDPLQLENSLVITEGVVPARLNIAHPWVDVDEDGVLDDLKGIPVTWKASLTHPVLFSTPTDLAVWMHELFVEESLLDDDSMEIMLRAPDVGSKDTSGIEYGLGVVDYSAALSESVIGHGGSALGYSAAALYLPEYEVVVVWMLNTGESPPELAADLMGEIWRSLFEVIRTHQPRVKAGDGLIPPSPDG